MIEAPIAMDVLRPRRRTLPKWLAPAAGVILLALLLVWALESLSTNNSSVVVDRSTVVTDTARQGTLLLTESVQGVFAPEHVRVVAASQAGVVNQVYVKAGNVVAPGTIIAQMENPALTADAINAQAALRVAQANLISARAAAQGAIVTQQTDQADAQATHAQDALQASSLASLYQKGLVSNLQYRSAQIQSEKSANEVRSSRAHVVIATADAQAKIAAAQAQVDEAAAQLSADNDQLASLAVRATSEGVVQTVDIDPGMSVQQGTRIASIADLHDLKAMLQVPESDVQSVVVGMGVRVDAGDGAAQGRVSRIAPTAENGTVAVDVVFPKPPPGGRSAANLDGTIELARIPNTISIARPAGAVDRSSIDLFKVVAGGGRAVRTRVSLGRGSGDRVQVLSGLAPGDTVIISDMSKYLNKTELLLR